MGLATYVQRIRAWRRSSAQDRGRRAPRNAFVLSGGGVLGAVQIGQLLALLERGIVPDLLVGTSVGALNAAYIAADPTPQGARTLAQIWTRLRADDVFPGGTVRRVWHIVARGDHIVGNEGLRRLIEHLPVDRIEELSVPLHVSATNLRTGEERWFSNGPVMPALLASTALPGILPPVDIDGERYIDGGVVNNVPISRAVELGATRIHVLTCAPPATHLDEQPIRRPLDVMVQAFAHSRAARVSLDLMRYEKQARVTMMPTFDPGLIRYDDPSHSERLIARSLRLSRRFLDAQEPAGAPESEPAAALLPAPVEA